MNDQQPTAMIDRVEQLSELRALSRRGKPGLALLYGRRRVGKTFLLDHAWRGERHLYFLAADTTADLNRQELLRELGALGEARNEFRAEDYPTWRSVFRLLADLAADAPLVVVLDEFQYLVGKEDDITSQLVAVWDRELRGRPLTLVLCGSEVATMERLEAGDGPLYGRWNWASRLRPFDYLDSAAMVPDREPREAALVYGIFGGTPRFLATIARGEELGARVATSVLSPRGEVHLQLERLIEQEKGIREPADYRALLAAIAAGNTKLDSIIQAAGLSERAGALRRLALLEGLELVERERNFDAHEKAAWHYRIADLAVRFWHHFVLPNRSLLEPGGMDAAHRVWAKRVQPHLNEYMGKVFERIVREAFARQHATWGYPAAIEWSRWEGRDRARRSIEIDLVGRLEDGRILTGEVKWSSRPVGTRIHDDLRRDLADLAQSGQRWAADALDPATSAGHLYVSAAGFAGGWDTVIKDSTVPVTPLSLEDLYTRR